MKKNILFILIDALREDHISTNKAIIPTIQKIKNNGFNFLSTTSSTSTTTPSFASLFTGLYPFENGVRSYSGYSLSKDIKTFPEILKENGYHTYAELTGPVLPELGLNKGFDEYNCRDRKNTIYTKWGEETLSKFKNHYKGPWFVFFHIFTLCFPRVVIKECQNKKFGKTQYARALSSVDTFLKKLIDTVDEDTLIIITSDHGEQIGKNHPEEFIKVKFKEVLKLLQKLKLMNAHYAKIARKIHIGHGFNIYDHLIKIPLIFYNKDIIHKGESKIPVRQIDIFPSILDIIGIDPKINVRGKSVLPIINNQDNTPREQYVEAVGSTIPKKEDWLAGLRIDNKYKFIYAPFRDDFKEELYFLETDPQEKNNVAKYNLKLVNKFKKKIESMGAENMIGQKIKEDDQKEVKERLKSLGYLD